MRFHQKTCLFFVSRLTSPMTHFGNLLATFDLSVVLIPAKSAFQDNSSFNTFMEVTLRCSTARMMVHQIRVWMKEQNQ